MSAAQDPPRLKKMVRSRDLPKYTGLSRTTINKMMEEGTFPRPNAAVGERVKAHTEDVLIVWQQERERLQQARIAAGALEPPELKRGRENKQRQLKAHIAAGELEPPELKRGREQKQARTKRERV